jgi:hypothetical protein
MLPLLTILILVPLLATESPGRVLRLSGNGFVLQLVEPDGWRLATRAAPQIANFIFHPVGEEWRRSDRVIFVRLVPRAGVESLESFIESTRGNFRERCLGGSDNLDRPTVREVPGFIIEDFSCFGMREEVLAFRQVPGYFVVFTLAVNPGGSLEEAVPVLRQILISFRWMQQSEPAAEGREPRGSD